MIIDTLLLTGYPGWFTTSFLNQLQNNKEITIKKIRLLVQHTLPSSLPLPMDKVEVVVGDLTHTHKLDEVTRGVEVILHAAGVIHVSKVQDWYTINSEGTNHLLKAALKNGVRQFIYLSSNAAFGKAPCKGVLCQEEESSSTKVSALSHYGRSKRLAELSLLAYRSQLEVVILRPCMFYGPPVPVRHLEIYRRLQNSFIPLIGGGDHDRGLTYIDHLVQAAFLSLQKRGAIGEIFFIADDQVYTTKEIVLAMGSALGCKVKFLPLPSLASKVAYLADKGLALVNLYNLPLHLLGEADWNVGVSITKAKELLGFSPTTLLPEGMKRAIDWSRSQMLL